MTGETTFPVNDAVASPSVDDKVPVNVSSAVIEDVAAESVGAAVPENVSTATMADVASPSVLARVPVTGDGAPLPAAKRSDISRRRLQPTLRRRPDSQSQRLQKQPMGLGR